jgi:hypothetical protein
MTGFSVRPSPRKARTIAAPIESARDAIGKIHPGLRVVGLNKGQFSLIDLITAVLEQVGAASVTVSTWTPGKIEIDAVLTMLHTHRITDFRLLVDRSFVSRHPGEARRLRRFGEETHYAALFTRGAG